MRTILFSLVLCCLCFAGYAQKIRFTDTRNVWNDFGFDADGHTWHPRHSYSRRPDSLIAGIPYKRFDLNAYLVREDTTAGIVYIYYHDTDRILYNYNLQIGDTISYAWNDREPRIDTVVSVDSTQINGMYHKILEMHGSGISGRDTIEKYRYNVIEGIGSAGGPLQPLLVYNFEGGEYVQCFEQDTTKPVTDQLHLKSAPGYFYNCGPTAVSNVSVQEKINVVPNPGNRYSKIMLPNTMTGKLVLLNEMGQVVSNKAFDNNTILPIGELPKVPGVYFYYITDSENGKVFSGKFIFED